MAQSGFTPIQHYRSATPAATPSAGNLAVGELALNYADGNLFFKDTSNIVRLLASTAAATGTVSSVQASGGTTGLTFTGGPITTSGTITLGGTLAVANGGTGATTAPNARTNLGATTVGSNFFTLTNPSAITFPRINADNTVSALDAASFRTAIGAGSGGGSVTSVDVSGGATGLTFTGGPITTSGTITAGGTLAVANGGTGVTTSTGTGAVVLNTSPTFGVAINVFNTGFAAASVTSDGSSETQLRFVSNTAARVTNQANTALVFDTNALERMRIDASGNVGIGTSSPVRRFDVRGGSIQVSNAAAGVAGDASVYFGNSTNNFIFGGDGNNVMAFATNGSERMRIDASGNLGVGTSNPTFRLVAANTSFDGSWLGSSGTFSYLGLGGYFGGTAGAAQIGYERSTGVLTFNIGSRDVPAERMRIDASGNVGIGASTSTDAKIRVLQTGSEVAFMAEGNNTPTYPQFGFSGQVGSNGGRGSGMYLIADSTIGFSTFGVERMRIDASGNVGIGGASSGEQLYCFASSGVQIAASSGTVSQRVGYCIEGAGAFSGSSSNHPYILTSNDTERMRINSSGNVGIGASSYSHRLHVETTTGVGSTFAVAANSNGVYPTTVFGLSVGYNFVAGEADVDFWNGWTGAAGTQGGFNFHRQTGASSEVSLLRLDGTGAVTSPSRADAVGYKGLPQNSQTTGYTLVLADQGKHISITTGGVTIPANGTTAFPIGTTIVVYNDSASTQTIAITTDTLRLAGTATTGTRTLAQRGLCTLVKVKATEWVATGNVT